MFLKRHWNRIFGGALLGLLVLAFVACGSGSNPDEPGTGGGGGFGPGGPLPTLSGVQPASGPASGGIVVTLSGGNLATARVVTLVGVNANIVSKAAGTVTVILGAFPGVVPPQGLTGDVLVTTQYGSTRITNGFTYVPAPTSPPTIATITPNNGPAEGGTTVTIGGVNMGAVTSVTFGGVPATIVSVSTNQVVVITGPFTGAVTTAVDVVVRNAAGPATRAGGYTYVVGGVPADLPHATAILPATGPPAGGTPVTVIGVNFRNGSGGPVDRVTFGTALECTEINVISDTQLTCVTPAYTGPVPPGGPVDVVVSNAGGEDPGPYPLFTYTNTPTGPVPNVTTYAPNQGPASGGTDVTFEGTNLTGVTAITLAGVPCQPIIQLSATRIQCKSGAFTGGVPATGDVSVANANGSDVIPDGWTYTDAPSGLVPNLTSISPNCGPRAGGTGVLIVGTNLRNVTIVTLSGISCDNIVHITQDTQISCTTGAYSGPSGISGDVIAENANGAGTLANAWTYDDSPACSGSAGGPQVTGIAPTGGPAVGGTPVTITGSGLTGATSATLAGVDCTDITVLSDTAITCVSGAFTGPVPSTGDVTVTTPNGTDALANGWTYGAGGGCPPADIPSISSVVPNSAPADGIDPATGTNPVTVRIFGANLTGVTTVLFAGVPASNVLVLNDTEIRAEVNPYFGAVPYTGDVVVDGGPCGPATLANGFTYTRVFKATSIDPDRGPQAGGQRVTITGFGLAGVGSVTICAVPAFVSDTGNTFVVAVTGVYNQSTPRQCDVVVSDGISTDTIVGGYTYVSDCPSVTGISPTCLHEGGGEAFTIVGTDLSGTSGVRLNDTSASSVKDVDDFTVTGVTGVFNGPVPTQGDVIVQTDTCGDFETGVRMTYILDPPVITDFTPKEGLGAGGQFVTITGGPFDVGPAGTLTVTVAGVPASVVSLTAGTTRRNQTLVVLTGAGCGEGPIVVSTYDGADLLGFCPPGIAGGGTAVSGATKYKYTVPAITTIEPVQGPESGGTLVTITGTGFLDVTSVTFGGVPAASFTVESDTKISAVSPPFPVNADTSVPVVVTGTCGSSSKSYLYKAVVPTISGVSISEGRCQGGDAIVITGSGFLGATAVTLANVPAASYAVVNDSTINALTGNYGCSNTTPLLGNVVVTVPAGQATLANGFTYYGVPSVTAATPSSGGAAGGTVVTVTGTNYYSVVGVRVIPDGSPTSCPAAYPGTNIQVLSATSLQFTTGASGASCTGVVEVTNGAGNGAGATFTYN